nr:MAG TPA: hypothetical protein [Caudoviricetes sp.]
MQTYNTYFLSINNYKIIILYDRQKVKNFY